MLNYRNALQVKQRLEQLGATVTLPNDQGQGLDYEDRMDPARQQRADFFLASHHNSTAESVDSNLYYGVEAYYYTDASQNFARNLTEILSQGLNRDNNGDFQSTYHVTKMTYAPSVLVELGYLPNPMEYERVSDPFVIYQTSFYLADAMLETIRAFYR